MTRTPSFRRYAEAGFLSELLPIIPPGAPLVANSTVRPEHLGKTPGTLGTSGNWSGLTGKWSDNLQATVAEAKRWTQWGASIGLQTREFLGLDIDVEDAATAARVEALAVEHLGMAPVRFRDGTPRRLLVYRKQKDHAPIRKTRFQWRDAAGVSHAVELLGHGQQFVADGPHPKGGAYRWRHDESPCELGPDGLTETTAARVEEFFQAVSEMIAVAGIAAGPVQVTGLTGTRKGLDDPAMWAPRPELALAVLAAWPNTAENVPTHGDFVAALAAIKAALGPQRESHFAAVAEWALGYDGNDGAYVEKTWQSITDSALGFEWLAAKARGAGVSVDADEDFDDGEAQEREDATPLAKMCARYVWCAQLERYVDLQSGEAITANALNAANVTVAMFGRSGVQSAAAEFQNAGESRKVASVTYQPGAPVILKTTNQHGARVSAVNLWRPSPIKPLAGITDAEVAPWLDLLGDIFGEQGDPAREHLLDWMAYAIQNPGRKINHALVIVGGQGVGKDSVFVPFLQAIGTHNYSTIQTEHLNSEFTPFLQKQVVVVEEIHNFSKRELYDKLKGWIAAPPATVRVNDKNLRAYEIPNIQLWVLFTNHEDAIAIDAEDRRFWVHKSQLETPHGAAYYTALYNWYRDGQAAAKVAGWLKARDVSAFAPGATPPSTAAKIEMAGAALPPATRWLSEELAEGGAFHGRRLLSVAELIAHCRSAFEAPPKVADTAREKHAVAALRGAGFAAIDRKLKFPGGGVGRLWTDNGRAGMFEQMDPAALIRKHAEEQAAGAPKRKGA